ncbi:MAG: DNA replication/repair protein RecF [Gammaproteobacteria bacterium]|nr:DNA replication/repair protein RecF [Gammaproteobacteria bacterium]
MILTHIDIQRFRILQDVSLDPSPGFNWITGINGSGKTSVLEAVQCLSVGHSFRSRKVKELIHVKQDDFLLTCEIQDPSNERNHRCGLQRHRDGTTELRFDYEPVRSMAAITQLLPVKALTPDSHRLIQDGPSGRRQFIDWGTFHVEHLFFDTWKQFRRTLSQRNQALRLNAPDAEVISWNEQLIQSGSDLDRMRREYLDKLNREVGRLLEAMGVSFPVTLKYRTGWADGTAFDDALERAFGNCRRLKTTTVGPHRADLIIESEGVLARQILSRGQQKVLVYALHLAQLYILTVSKGVRAIVLCDDLSSELDDFHSEKILAQLQATNSQVFLSGTTLKTATDGAFAHFEVSNGEVRKVV